jgi:hypothetical protein
VLLVAFLHTPVLYNGHPLFDNQKQTKQRGLEENRLEKDWGGGVVYTPVIPTLRRLRLEDRRFEPAWATQCVPCGPMQMIATSVPSPRSEARGSSLHRDSLNHVSPGESKTDSLTC